MTSVLRVCFIHKYDGAWHLKFHEVYEHSVTIDEIDIAFPSLQEARKALVGLKPESVLLIQQDAGELWG